MNLKQAQEQIFKISQATSESALLDSQVLLAQISGQTRAWVIAHSEDELSSEQEAALTDALELLENGMPLPYVLGEWPFFGRKFNISPDVLIPRPETELLVQTALDWLNENPERRKGIDVGTGSGIIPITLACEIPNLEMQAVDISPAAIIIAGENAVRHDVDERIQVRENDLLTGIDGPFDLICANLPYIPTETLHGLVVFEKEPTLALDGGADGLDLIRELVNDAQSKLIPEGLMLLEIDASQGNSAAQVAQAAFPEARVTILPDLAGHARIVQVERGAR